MKNILSFSLVLLIAGLIGCGKNEDNMDNIRDLKNYP